MKPSTEKKLNMWASSKNWGDNNPIDEDNFIDFIIEAYRNGDKSISSEQFGKVVPKSIEEDKMMRCYYEYEFGILLIKRFDKQ